MKKNKMSIIIKEVYRKNIFSWAFFFMVFGPLIMMAVVGGIGFLIVKDSQASSYGQIAVVNAKSEIQEVIKASEPKNNYQFDLTKEEAEKSLKANQIEGYLLFKQGEHELAPVYYRQATSKDIKLKSIQEGLSHFQLQKLVEQMGLTSDQLKAIQANQVNIQTIKLKVDNQGKTRATDANNPVEQMKSAVAYGVCFIVFMFIMNYIGIISQEIAAEKGSRIMEIILSSVSATSHFFGKMIGIGLVILTQLAIYLVMYGVIRVIIEQFDLLNVLEQYDINLGSILANSSDVIGLGGLYALIGILIYSSIAGFLGSLVSRTEDVQKMITPITLLAVAGFYIGMYALNSTNNPVVQIGSLIPFFTPFVMPFRIAAGTVSTSQIILSIILSLIFMGLALYLSAMFYKSNVLVYSDKGLINTFKRSYQLWKSEREAS
ncbi:ABC transporter permease [Vaginisenegalia massiliensis]|uniref:ABC transporter permease n=1 Tax=Vaginisenegalia massiliensis TaxID=2058294 RepID=UPI000F542893|nr:ABC transporter permease [Vaginisenegalia massiliensis]